MIIGAVIEPLQIQTAMGQTTSSLNVVKRHNLNSGTRMFSGAFPYFLKSEELNKYSKPSAQELRQESTRKYFLSQYGIDVDNIKMPSELTSNALVAGRWRQEHTGNLETVLINALLKKYDVNLLDLGLFSDHFSGQSSEKKYLTTNVRRYDEGIVYPELIVARPKERQVMGTIKTIDNQNLKEYHENLYKKITGKSWIDVSDFFSTFLKQYLENTDSRPKIWIEDIDGLANSLTWDPELKKYKGFEKTREGTKTTEYDLETILDYAEKTKARPDGEFNYREIYPALLGLTSFVPMVSPWEDDDMRIQKFASELYNTTKTLTGQIIPTIPFFNIGNYAPAKKLLGNRPEQTILSSNPNINISKGNSIYETSENITRKLIDDLHETTKKRNEIHRKVHDYFTGAYKKIVN